MTKADREQEWHEQIIRARAAAREKVRQASIQPVAQMTIPKVVKADRDKRIEAGTFAGGAPPHHAPDPRSEPGDVCPTCGHRQAMTTNQRQQRYRRRKREAQVK